MMRFFLILALLCQCAFSFAQVDGDFYFGKAGPRDFTITRYEKDSSANALVLKEFGKASIEITERSSVVFYHHVRIKILNKSGFDHANVKIKLKKYSRENETIQELRASTFNLKAGRMGEVKLDPKSVITENTNENYYQTKFTLPDIMEGSVIEYSYTTISPSAYNFHEWQFQDDIPKLHCEFWAKIPAVYDYNANLRGYQQLKKSESELVSRCMFLSGQEVNCSLNKYIMEDVPAFYEEEYMTSRYNFISAIKYELKTIYHLDGMKDEITKTWSDVDEELRRDEKFGLQIRKDRSNLWKDDLDTLLVNCKDTLAAAKKIYSFISRKFIWNQFYGIFAGEGIRSAFLKGKGNVADINLSLISALRYAGIDADPVILSTRYFESVTRLYPVITDFKYVIARFMLGGKEYFLDATEKNLPFGVLPVRCLSGQGRLIGNKFKSDWINIPSTGKNKTIYFVKLQVSENGNFTGTINSNYSGYQGFELREKINQFNSVQKYTEHLNKSRHFVLITAQNVKNLRETEEPLKFELQLKSDDADTSRKDKIYFNPLFDFRIAENPFKAKDRLYPVDFAYPRDFNFTANIEFPSNYEVESVPEKISLTLPGSGVKYTFMAAVKNNVILISGSLSVVQTLYSSEQYHYLKELYSRIVKAQSEDIVLRKKS